MLVSGEIEAEKVVEMVWRGFAIVSGFLMRRGSSLMEVLIAKGS
jgi:hypothetical protein